MGYTHINTLLIGNGFDLSLDLKTSYNDFHSVLKDVFDTKIRNHHIFIDKWKSEGIKLAEEYGAAELFYKIYDNKDNFFVKYFSNAKYNEWNELEKELEKIYLTLDILLEDIHSIILNEKKVMMSNKRYIIRNIYNYPTPHIFDYIDKWKDFEFSMNESFVDEGLFYDRYFETNPISKINQIERINELKATIPKLLYEDLLLFCNLFTLYLNVFTNNIPIVKNKIFASYIFSYNYTEVAEKIINADNIIHLHGKFKYDENVNINGWKNDSIVFGVDDKTKFINSGFERFKKTIIRCMIDSDISKLDDNLKSANKIPNLKKAIWIVGHSLDLIDEDSLRMILRNNWQEYVVFYYNEEAKFNLIYNLRAILGVDNYEKLYNSGSILYRPVSDFSNRLKIG